MKHCPRHVTLGTVVTTIGREEKTQRHQRTYDVVPIGTVGKVP